MAERWATCRRNRSVASLPDLGQEARRVQLGEHGRVDLIGLHLGVRDRPHQEGVRDDHALDQGREQLGDREGVAGGLEDHLILRPQMLPSEGQDLLPRQLDPAELADGCVLHRRGHGEASMHIKADHPHALLLPCSVTQEPADSTTSTDPRSRRTRVGRRGGQILTRARSSVCSPACPPSVLPVPLSRLGRDYLTALGP